MSVEEKQYVVFKTLKRTHVAILPQPFMVIYRNKDGKVTRRRPAQYCESLESIFIDQQKKIDEKPQVTPQYFKKGRIAIPIDNLTLLSIFREHELNEANGGDMFKEYDATKEETEKILALQEEDELKAYVLKADDALVRAMGLFLIGSSALRKTPQNLKLRIREKIEQNKDFKDRLKAFKNEKNHTPKTIITIALHTDVIQLEGKTFKWTDSAEPIYKAAQQKDAVVDFANFLINDEKGRQDYESIMNRIEEQKS